MKLEDKWLIVVVAVAILFARPNSCILRLGHKMGHSSQLAGQRGQACVIVFLTNI